MFSSCPICQLTLPLLGLEWHVNGHLEEDELARDMELAQQIALAPQSPPKFKHKGSNSVEPIESTLVDVPGSNTPRHINNSRVYGERQAEEKLDCLIRLQIRSTFCRVEEGLMVLLRNCLELERENTCSIISGHVDHFQSFHLEDSGWGCGWRNIQMLSSHLLMQRQDAKEVLFGGSGFVPDIPSLQRWLEIAWEMGFDVPGSESFDCKIYGSTKWIGTTECAALLRFFGLRARVIDFVARNTVENAPTGYSTDEKIVKRKYGPMDKYMCNRHGDDYQVGPSNCEESKHGNRQDEKNFSRCAHSLVDYDRSNKCTKKKIHGHYVLIDWVWNYFSGKRFDSSGNLKRVIVSEKTPLYFQHDGHSRTTVGIQIQWGMPERCTLLVLDPSQKTAALASSLRDNVGWQKVIKRGMHTLKKPQYQLCYVDPGIASGKELEQLKIIDSIPFEC